MSIDHTKHNDYKPGKPNAISALRRTLIYIIRVLILVMAGCLVCILAFFTAERGANLYILTTEGMKLRAEEIIKGAQEESQLQDYFTASWINQDAALTDQAYKNYSISSFDYDLTIQSIFVLPWANSATVTAIESVTVNGTYNSDRLGDGDSAANHPLPEWPVQKVTIHFITNGTRWFISEITVKETNPDLAPQSTPDPDMTPLPMATPTPIPDPTPTPLPRLEVIS